MKTMNLAAFLFIAVLSSGCASITGSKNQPVSVETISGGVPAPGAACKLSNDKGVWYVPVTPGSTFIQKAYGDLAVECMAKSGARGIGLFKSSSNTGVFGNIIFGGVVGFAIDASSGAGFDYPPTMTVDIPRLDTAVAPSVETGSGVMAPASSTSISTIPVAAMVAASPNIAAPVAATPIAFNPVAVAPVAVAPVAVVPAAVAPVPVVPVAVVPAAVRVPERSNALLSAKVGEPLVTGKFLFSAERLAREQSCTAKTSLVAIGPGFESYTTACPGGEAIMIRCDFGQCRVLR